MSTRLSTRDAESIAKALAAGDAFATYGSLAGRPHDGGPIHAGRLPGDWARTLQARSHVITFVISSYATPIAWHDLEAGWILPDESYSVTTSRHQSRIRHALHLTGSEVSP